MIPVMNSLEKEFENCIQVVWSGKLPKESRQYSDLRRMFFTGAIEAARVELSKIEALAISRAMIKEIEG